MSAGSEEYSNYESANGGIIQPKLLTRANLTSDQLRQYVDILIEKSL
jgi:hypothetical protein